MNHIIISAWDRHGQKKMKRGEENNVLWYKKYWLFPVLVVQWANRWSHGGNTGPKSEIMVPREGSKVPYGTSWSREVPSIKSRSHSGTGGPMLGPVVL